MAGVLRVDWRWLSLRQLVAMYEGYMLHHWDAVTLLSADLKCLQHQVRYLFSTKRPPAPPSFYDLHPYRSKPKNYGSSVKLTPENLSVLKAFCK